MRTTDETTKGAWATTAAFLTWGLVPLYWKAVEAISAHEMIAWRVLWALPFLAVFLTMGRGWSHVRAVLRKRHVMAVVVVSASLIAVNWFVFIEAVADNRVLEASLGYYINPLVNVLLGAAFLGEKLGRAQWTAVGLAAAGVAVLVVATGTLPVTALVLALTFAAYGLVRKLAHVEAMPGLFLEVVVVSPFAIAWLLVLQARGAMSEGVGAGTWALVPLAGLITALPLWWFAYGARRLRLATVGLLQFLAPTGQFLLSIAVFGEPFSRAHGVAFALIWAGLVLYVLDLRRRQRRAARIAAAAV